MRDEELGMSCVFGCILVFLSTCILVSGKMDAQIFQKDNK